MSVASNEKGGTTRAKPEHTLENKGEKNNRGPHEARPKLTSGAIPLMARQLTGAAVVEAHDATTTNRAMTAAIRLDQLARGTPSEC